MILGTKFLKRYAAVINLDTEQLILNNFDNTIKLNERELHSADLDDLLVSKSIGNTLNKDECDFFDFNLQFTRLIKLNPKEQKSNCKPVKFNYNKNICVNSKAYTIQTLLFQKFKEKINTLLKEGAMQKTTSKISSPVFIIKKGLMILELL